MNTLDKLSLQSTRFLFFFSFSSASFSVKITGSVFFRLEVRCRILIGLATANFPLAVHLQLLAPCQVRPAFAGDA